MECRPGEGQPTRPINSLRFREGIYLIENFRSLFSGNTQKRHSPGKREIGERPSGEARWKILLLLLLLLLLITVYLPVS